MGSTTRSGFGFGMDKRSAQRDFVSELNRQYGEDLYSGGGNDIQEWQECYCVEPPVPASGPSKTESVRTAPKADGKLVNGFLITTETPELLRMQMRAQYSNDSRAVPEIVQTFALKQSDAKHMANEMALKHHTLVHVLPARLWQDTRTNRLSLPVRIAEIVPVGGQEAKQGKWRFTVEVSI